MTAESDPLVGTTVAGRYAVESLLGKGGMGAVYRARQIELDREVAIKVIAHELARSEHAIERFRREAAATAKLRHPNIVTVYDFAQLEDGRMYIVMELLKGPTLEAWLAERGTATPTEALDIVRQVCKALGALHRSGVVHRDIKPANIVLDDPDDPYDSIKVLDFGIARLRDTSGPKLTGKSILGTPEYLAPEVIEGEEADARTDVYALGVIAYQMLAGKLPFTAATNGAILLQHLTKTPAAPSKANPALDERVDAAVLKALEKDRSDRYQTADELAAALASALGGGDAPVVAVAPAAASVAPPPEPATAKILVIDDEEDLRTVNQVALEGAGYRVDTAGDGIEALLKLGGGGFDLVLSDVDMPNLDGFKLLEMLAAKGVATPVIFVTGRVDAENEVRGLELGAEDYLRKPLVPAVLLARVKAALAKRR